MADGAARRTVTRRMVLGLLGTTLLPAGRVRASSPISDADRTALVTGNSEFGLDLYARLFPHPRQPDRQHPGRRAPDRAAGELTSSVASAPPARHHARAGAVEPSAATRSGGKVLVAPR
jgi:hypothetical protein